MILYSSLMDYSLWWSLGLVICIFEYEDHLYWVKNREIHDHNLPCMSNFNNELTFLYIFPFNIPSMSRIIRFIKEKV